MNISRRVSEIGSVTYVVVDHHKYVASCKTLEKAKAIANGEPPPPRKAHKTSSQYPLEVWHPEASKYLRVAWR